MRGSLLNAIENNYAAITHTIIAILILKRTVMIVMICQIMNNRLTVYFKSNSVSHFVLLSWDYIILSMVVCILIVEKHLKCLWTKITHYFLDSFWFVHLIVIQHSVNLILGRFIIRSFAKGCFYKEKDKKTIRGSPVYHHSFNL